MREQEGQTSTFSLHPQFAYVESTKQKQQLVIYSKTSIKENRQKVYCMLMVMTHNKLKI